MRPRHLYLASSVAALALAASCTSDNPVAPVSPGVQPHLVIGATGDPITYCNPAVITIVDNARANPYPSVITVDGLPAGSYQVTATVRNFTHPVPADVDMVLEGPGGQKVMLMSDANAVLNQFLNVTLTFDDDAPAFVQQGVPTLSIASSWRPPFQHRRTASSCRWRGRRRIRGATTLLPPGPNGQPRPWPRDAASGTNAGGRVLPVRDKHERAREG